MITEENLSIALLACELGYCYKEKGFNLEYAKSKLREILFNKEDNNRNTNTENVLRLSTSIQSP